MQCIRWSETQDDDDDILSNQQLLASEHGVDGHATGSYMYIVAISSASGLIIQISPRDGHAYTVNPCTKKMPCIHGIFFVHGFLYMYVFRVNVSGI